VTDVFVSEVPDVSRVPLGDIPAASSAGALARILPGGAPVVPVAAFSSAL
jgi:FXSXX-COOH protein